MAQKPPPLPSEILQRVLAVATIDGRLLMVTAASFAFLQASAHEATGALVGVLVAGAGALELHGAGIIRNGDSRGMDWLVRSQLLLLATMLIYSAVQLMNFDPSEISRIPLSDAQKATIAELNLTTEQFAQMANTIVYVTVGIVSFFYQGAMALYYHRRRSAVTLALDDELLDALREND